MHSSAKILDLKASYCNSIWYKTSTCIHTRSIHCFLRKFTFNKFGLGVKNIYTASRSRMAHSWPASRALIDLRSQMFRNVTGKCVISNGKNLCIDNNYWSQCFFNGASISSQKRAVFTPSSCDELYLTWYVTLIQTFFDSSVAKWLKKQIGDFHKIWWRGTQENPGFCLIDQ